MQPPQLVKARASEQDAVTAVILTAARKALLDIQQRCSEALKAIEHNDHLVVLGALAGLEEQIRFVSMRLMVLREIKEIQKQNHKERRKP